MLLAQVYFQNAHKILVVLLCGSMKKLMHLVLFVSLSVCINRVCSGSKIVTLPSPLQLNQVQDYDMNHTSPSNDWDEHPIGPLDYRESSYV